MFHFLILRCTKDFEKFIFNIICIFSSYFLDFYDCNYFFTIWIGFFANLFYKTDCILVKIIFICFLLFFIKWLREERKESNVFSVVWWFLYSENDAYLSVEETRFHWLQSVRVPHAWLLGDDILCRRCWWSWQLTRRYSRNSLPARYRQRSRRRWEWEIVYSPSSQLKLFLSLPISFSKTICFFIRRRFKCVMSHTRETISVNTYVFYF